MTNKEMAAYLRCTIKVSAESCDPKCHYLHKEEIKPDFPMRADLVEDGVEYWTSCDYERMMEDAARMLEESERKRGIVEDDEGTEVW